MGDIGPGQKEYEFEPLVTPETAPIIEPAPAPATPTPERETVPA